MATFRFDPNANLVTLRATVVGQRLTRVVMAVDTGSTMTFISRDVAFDIGLDPDAATDWGQVASLSQVETAPLLTLSRVGVGELAVPNPSVACKDFPLPLQLQVDGLLGLNFLRHFKLFVNFAKGVLVLQERNPRHLFHRLSQVWELLSAHR